MMSIRDYKAVEIEMVDKGVVNPLDLSSSDIVEVVDMYLRYVGDEVDLLLFSSIVKKFRENHWEFNEENFSRVYKLEYGEYPVYVAPSFEDKLEEIEERVSDEVEEVFSEEASVDRGSLFSKIREISLGRFNVGDFIDRGKR